MKTSENRPLIRVEKLVKSFGSHVVLRELDLDIEEGETLVVIGQSGCGKSVLLKHLIGIIQPDAGRVFFGEKEISGASERQLNEIRKRFGMVFQGAALFDSLNVEQNVGFALREHTRLAPDEIRKTVKEKLALVGLEGVEEMMPADLSGGMKKRVALARAIAFDPEVVLYDEPTTGIDPVMAESINDLILGLANKLRVTSVVVTHDMRSACHIADRIAMLEEGRIIDSGRPEEITKSDHPSIRKFTATIAAHPVTGRRL